MGNLTDIEVSSEVIYFLRLEVNVQVYTGALRGEEKVSHGQWLPAAPHPTTHR